MYEMGDPCTDHKAKQTTLHLILLLELYTNEQFAENTDSGNDSFNIFIP